MGESDWSFDHMRSSSSLPLPCKEMLHLPLHLSAISCNYLSQQGQLQRLRSSCRADQPGIVAAHCFLPCCLFSFDLCSLHLVLFSQYALLIQVVTACHAHSCKQNRWPATFSKCSSLGYHRKGVCVCVCYYMYVWIKGLLHSLHMKRATLCLFSDYHKRSRLTGSISSSCLLIRVNVVGSYGSSSICLYQLYKSCTGTVRVESLGTGNACTLTCAAS